jgi:putative transposase
MKRHTELSYAGCRYPTEIVAHAVWLYFRFTLSLRDVAALLSERGFVVTYETVRQWGLRFGRAFANALRRREPRRGDKWHLDEVFITIDAKAPLLVASGRPRGRHTGSGGAVVYRAVH